jgi:hypothetical protein
MNGLKIHLLVDTGTYGNGNKIALPSAGRIWEV